MRPSTSLTQHAQWRHARIVVLLSIFFLLAPAVLAQAPQGTAFTYQGVLKQNGAAKNGNTDMVFDLFDAAVGGNPVGPSLPFTSAHGNPVNVQNGVFGVTLDFGAAAFITPISDQRFLRVTVNGTALAPRTPIQNAPFGLQSQTAELAYSVSNASIGTAQIVASQVQRRISGTCTGGATISSVNQDGSVNCQNGSGTGTITGVTAGNGLTGGGTSGSVSLGISNPLNLSGTAAGGVVAVKNTAANGIAVQGSAKGASSMALRGQSDAGIGVRGEASSTTSASANGVYGLSQSSAASGVVGVDYANYGVYGAGATGVYGTGTYGVQGFSTTVSGAGVWGSSSAGGARGVYGESTADNGAGVEGVTSGANGAGVEGIDANGTGVLGSGTTGVEGDSNSASGYGVYGRNAATTGSGTGVYGQSDSTLGTGVWGFSSATTGEGNGVYGQSDSLHGFGIHGYASTTIVGYGIGVYGNSAYGQGVVGYSTHGDGVMGSSNTGRAGYFSGQVEVMGTLTKGGGAFKIDHPLDPANKYLYHSFVESPDMKNVYDGIASLDASGEAWVELPSYFEALNRDFRYQLTALDAPAPALYVAQRIEGNRFKLAGGAPNQQVSWQVTGTRKDAYAEAHRIVPEVDKLQDERGKYIYPTLFGQPESIGIGYERIKALRDHKIPVPPAATPPAPHE